MNGAKSSQRARLFTLFWLIVALVALLASGALQFRHNFLTRGLPDGLPQPVNFGGVQPGLNVALHQYDDAALADNLQQIADLGVQFVKQPFYFSEEFDWAAADRLVTAVSHQNLTFIPLLDGNPDDNFAPVETAVFAQWTAEFATRYGDEIQFYIIWDEPNLASHWGNQPPNPDAYGALLSAAASAIRAADGDAVIVAAPLAPTVETGPANLADPLYLQRLYEAGAAPAFDVAAAKPYGFHTGPDDRRVDLSVLNFSRAILLREVMEHNGDGGKALWAGNWGWNSLPADWPGALSIWGEVTPQQRTDWITAAHQRAQQEWPWMGLMFLENWEPNAPPNDPRWGFSIKKNIEAGDWLPHSSLVTRHSSLVTRHSSIALPGFHPARPDDPAQVYVGGWRFSSQFGADISETGVGEAPDEMTFTFWGTDVGLRVRRANFRARLYVTIDGQPANALPRDENGSMLILTAADPAEDYLSTAPIATGLEPGIHTVHITASRGWDQWALNGFSVAYHHPRTAYHWGMGLLGITAVSFSLLAIRIGRRAEWLLLRRCYHRLGQWAQLALTAVLAAIVALTGWLTWSAPVEGIYRRLGDVGQLTLTAGTAVIFYVSPTFLIYALALGALFILIYLRPAWGLALIAFSFPFYILPKPALGYLFSPVEVFTLVTFAAVVSNQLLASSKRYRHSLNSDPLNNSDSLNTDHRLLLTDFAVLTFVAIATLSLLFTARLDVASNEWRVVILEPALFYLMLRRLHPSEQEMWVILDAFVLGGVVVAAYGLWQVAFDRAALITAEGGLLRLKSVFGSPNNVGLYLGRILPLLAASFLLGQGMNPRRRRAYTLAALPIALALLLSFSKGALFLGMPAALLFVGGVWLKRNGRLKNGRSPWPWLFAIILSGVAAILIAQRIPALAGRLNLTGATGVFRLNLWQSSVNMLRDHPLFGVGLDNFLYAYRGRYILDAAWQEPNLNHPHNILLDFATRLGLLGLFSGGWLLWQLGRGLKQAWATAPPAWQPIVIGCTGAFIAMLAHGLVDHSFFLVDLAFVFYLLLATAVWLTTTRQS
ncbi:MAG: O-antigen ligase family protein [Anaerolinea sp.]|nr:O-antigen ligase family protein [Anaerolinea sp.]